MKSRSHGRVIGLASAVLLGIGALSCASDGIWEARTPRPTVCAGHRAISYGGIVYVSGGGISHFDPTRLARLDAYDPALDAWSARAPMSVERESHGFAALGGLLYATGGTDSSGNPRSTVEAYDPVSDTWSPRASLPQARATHASAVVGGLLYVIGGRVGAVNPSRSVYAYDPASNAWTERADLTTARGGAPCAVAIGGRIYVAGGGSGGATASLEVYDPASNMWTTKAPMTTAREGAAAMVLDGKMVVVGGWSNGPPISSAEQYDPATDTWTSLPSLPESAAGLTGDVADGVAYVFGGVRGPSSTFSGATDALVPASNEAPVADAGVEQTIECQSAAGAEVTLDGTASSDADGDLLTFLWIAPDGVSLDDPTSAQPTGMFPIGVHLVTLLVSDGRGGSATGDVVVTVEDCEPPLASCTTDLAVLWPPKHERVSVEVRITVSDACTDPGALVLESLTVTSDEPDDAGGNGDGSTTGDVAGHDGFGSPVELASLFSYDEEVGAFVGVLRLRAERSGTGDGRAYAVTARVEDPSGNATSAGCVIVVPHSSRK